MTPTFIFGRRVSSLRESLVLVEGQLQDVICNDKDIVIKIEQSIDGSHDNPLRGSTRTKSKPRSAQLEAKQDTLVHIQ